MVRAIHMHIDKTNSLITNIQSTAACKQKNLNCDACGEIAAVILRKVGRIWELTEQTCVSQTVLLFCSDELLNDWALDEPGLVFDPLTLYWWLVSSALNTYGPLPLIQEIAREVTHTITARGGSIIDLNTKCEGEGCDGLER